jgi:hypothetical protein
MKTISKFDFITDNYIILDEEEHLVLEIATGKQFIATPLDTPEMKVMLQTPEEFINGQANLIKNMEKNQIQINKFK